MHGAAGGAAGRPKSVAPKGKAPKGTGMVGAGVLPAGWAAATDDTGNVYYWHAESGTTQWDVPT